MADSKTYHWCIIKHPDQPFWGVPERMPWPIEAESKPDPKVRYPAGDMREGVRRLRDEGGAEWNEQWAALDTFCDRGDELSAMIERGEMEAGLRVLDELEALRPGTGYCPFNRSFFLRTQGDLAGARAAAILACERMPKVEWAWMRRGDLHEQLDEQKDAIFCFRKALALLPGHLQALEGLCRCGVMCRLASILPDGRRELSFHPPDEFRDKMAADIARQPPDSPNLRHALPQFLDASKCSEPELALLTIDRILSGSPPDALALRIQRADALRQLKRFDEARDILKAILREDPRNAQAHYVKAWCCFDRKQINRGWNYIDATLCLDPNHQNAIMVKFGIGAKAKPGTVGRITAWAGENKSWRAYFCAAVQCATDKDPAGCLRWAEAAYRLAPHERDALFVYANSLNNAHEGEYTAALIHPRLPELKGDFLLKFVFAGAMKRLGLQDEAIRILREALAEGGDMTDEIRTMIQDFHDVLTGLLARSDIGVDFYPGTPVLRRSIWLGTDEGPESSFLDAGQPVPLTRDVMLSPFDPAQTTGSLTFLLHSDASSLDPLSLGWFRVHDIDYITGPQPAFTLRITKKGQVEGLARQGDRRLPVTWTLYRVPSMEMEKPREP